MKEMFSVCLTPEAVAAFMDALAQPAGWQPRSTPGVGGEW